MKTTYLVWEDPSCEGINPSWQELNGQEFLALVRSAEAVGRYFVKLESIQKDTAIVIEATRASYLAWKKEKNHREYLESCAKGKTTFSYHAMEADGSSYGEELLEDKAADVVAECLMTITSETLKDALASLTANEYGLIAYLYLSERKGTERGYAALSGIPQKTLNDRKKRILHKLKDFFEE